MMIGKEVSDQRIFQKQIRAEVILCELIVNIFFIEHSLQVNGSNEKCSQIPKLQKIFRNNLSQYVVQ